VVNAGRTRCPEWSAGGLAFFAEIALITDVPVANGQLYPPPYEEKKTMAKATAPKKPLTKTELLASVAATTGFPKKDVAAVLEALAAEIKTSLGNKGPGVITIPGLVKIEKKKIPARKAQKGVPNPFKPGELMDRAAKPAYNKVKVRALKLLKDMAK
jgi:nucleoid DNA-binding protein